MPEGLRALAGEVRELVVRSTRLAVVPVWVGELTRLEALEVSGEEYDPKSVLKSLPASLGQLGSLKELTLACLGGLEILPDAVVRLTSLGSLTIDKCGKLRALMMMILLLFLQKQNLAFAVYQFGSVLSLPD